jgi:PDDEXK-like domain of unknown function (DUF3799)
MSLPLPIAGFHHGLPYEQYAEWDAINFSRLKPILDTPSKCKYGIDNPKAMTPAMKLGSALHVAVLEPARFESLFYICPPCDRKTTEGKALYAEAVEKANGKLVLREGSQTDAPLMGEVAKIRGMAASIRNLKSAAPFLNGTGQNEVSALWQDSETGLMCKGRFDRFLPEFELLDGAPVVVEIKSTKDGSDWAFGKEVDGYNYDAQAANYLTGVKSITGKKAGHVFIVVENFPPYDAAFYMLGDQDLQTGLRKYRSMLSRYAECKKTNRWPGYEDKLKVLYLPGYAHERKYNQ